VAELYEGSGEDRGQASYLKKVKLADKEKALQALGKHLMMFPTKPVDVNITDSLADTIQKARKRVTGVDRYGYG